MRNVFTIDDQGAVVLAVQVRTICRRPTRVDSEGWPLADYPGPHPSTPIPFSTINRRPVREDRSHE